MPGSQARGTRERWKRYEGYIKLSRSVDLAIWQRINIDGLLEMGQVWTTRPISVFPETLLVTWLPTPSAYKALL